MKHTISAGLPMLRRIGVTLQQTDPTKKAMGPVNSQSSSRTCARLPALTKGT